MSTVGELFHSLDRDEVIAAILRLYPEQPGDHPDGYLQAWDIIRAKQAASPSDVICELYMHPSFDDPPEMFVGVHGRKDGDEDRYAIEYNPWVEWLSMPIDVLPECGDLPEIDVLAHIFWEMTWAGYDDQQIEDQKTEIMDRVDEVKEMIAADPDSALQ
jgi:hypothetical protein